jgi:hypothetical protein
LDENQIVSKCLAIEAGADPLIGVFRQTFWDPSLAAGDIPSLLLLDFGETSAVLPDQVPAVVLHLPGSEEVLRTLEGNRGLSPNQSAASLKGIDQMVIEFEIIWIVMAEEPKLIVFAPQGQVRFYQEKLPKRLGSGGNVRLAAYRQARAANST